MQIDPKKRENHFLNLNMFLLICCYELKIIVNTVVCTIIFLKFLMVLGSNCNSSIASIQNVRGQPFLEDVIGLPLSYEFQLRNRPKHC